MQTFRITDFTSRHRRPPGPDRFLQPDAGLDQRQYPVKLHNIRAAIAANTCWHGK